MKRRFGLISISMGLALLSNAAARANYAIEGGQAVVRPGVMSGIKSFFNCQTKGLYGVSGVAQHGTISTKEGTGKACGQRNFPKTLVFYTPNPGFVGIDDVNLFVGRVVYTVKVTVQQPTEFVTPGHRSAGSTGEAGHRPRLQ